MTKATKAQKDFDSAINSKVNSGVDQKSIHQSTHQHNHQKGDSENHIYHKQINALSRTKDPHENHARDVQDAAAPRRNTAFQP